jgi:hypothetical protein
MVSWGPSRADGSKFYKGMKEEPPWVQDLNWTNQCKLENRKFMKKKMLAKRGSVGNLKMTSIPPYETGMKEKIADSDLKKYIRERDGVAGESTTQSARSARSTARYSSRSNGPERGAYASARSSARSSARFSTGRSSIGTINTEMKDLIRETAENELKALKEALQREAELRAASDKKIELLLHELQSLKK